MMPVVEVGDRLNTRSGRSDLAADLVGLMAHPREEAARRKLRSAFAMTLRGMSDRNDDPAALLQAKSWFREAGGFKTASTSDPYEKQQTDMVRQLPNIIAVGHSLDLVWAMDVHHRAALPGGASLNKAFAIIRDPLSRFVISERSLRSAWAHYKPVAHLCAGFAVAFQQAHNGDPAEIDERMKSAYVEQLHVMVSLIGAFQRFATTFIPYGQSQPLVSPQEIYFLRGIDAEELFVPPLLPELLSVAKAYRAPLSNAYR
jgi:hypothetical protein